MPVVRVPVVHKFGIVSVSRAEQLLRDGRAGKPSQPSSGAKSTPRSSAPSKISQSFIEKYNKASNVERQKLDRIVQRAISQAKYKAGLCRSRGSTSGTSREVEIGGSSEAEYRVSSAWLELILLCQCYGNHQEDVLLTLAVSLNHAPLSHVHIPSLLYMCGLCYQWLKSDLSLNGSNSDCLRTGELTLLRIVYLISLRLYCHYITGTLLDVCTREDIRQLKFDLEGFESREKVYRNFPEALLHWKVALEVGQTIVERNRPLVLHDLQHDPSPGETATNSGSGSVRGVGKDLQGRKGARKMSLALKYSLEVWRAVRGQGKLENAIGRFTACPNGFNTDNWLESVLSISILCQASQLSLPVLHLFQSLATHSHPKPSSSPLTTSPYRNQKLQSSDAAPPSTIPSLSPSRINASLFTKDQTTRNSSPSLHTKKGTRFVLPQTEDISGGSIGDNISSHFPSPYDYGRHHQVDTLNIAGQQPPFHEPYPESIYSETGQNLEEIFPNRDLVNVNERRIQLLEASGSKSAPVFGGTTLSTSNTPKPLIEEAESGLLALHSVMLEEEEEESGAGERSSCGTPITDKLGDLVSTLGESFVGNAESDEPPSQRGVIFPGVPRNLETRCTHYTHSSSALSGGAGVPGSHIAPSTIYRQSLYSPLTIDDIIEPDEDRETQEDLKETENVNNTTGRVFNTGFESWPSEVCLAYTLGMGDVVIYGRNSQIQSAALEGVVGSRGERLVGLRHLVEFSSNDSDMECTECPKCMSWMVRHCAVLSLSRICHVNKAMVAKDGMAGSVWSLLMKSHSSETNSRVLEAFKLYEVCPDIDSPLLAIETASLSSPLLMSIADQLARGFLPPTSIIKLPAITSKSPPKRIIKPVGKTLPQATAKVDNHHKKSPTDQKRHEGGFTGRTLKALHDIIERDWRREMEKEREHELSVNTETETITF